MRLWFLILFGFALFTSCGGCGDPCDDVLCTNGFVCSEGQCVDPESVCDPSCVSGAVCIGGQCVVANQQCTAPRESCNPALPVNDDFFCIDTDGLGPLGPECVEFCGQNGACPNGTLCFLVNSNLDPVCSSVADCAEGKTCQEGRCRDQICRPSECEGFLSGIETCQNLHGSEPGYSNGAQCADFGNGANFCFPAGAAEVGEACLDLSTAFDLGELDRTCESGAACIDGRCRTACSDDAGCPDEECLLADEDLVGNGVGICGKSCTPFEEGGCASGEGCVPIDATTGVCVPTGEREVFDVCTQGTNDCVDGSVCVTFDDTTGIARCLPLCDLSAGPANDDGTVGEFAQTQRDATCPQPEPVGAFFQIANFAELASAVDVYLGDETTPTFSNIAFGAVTDSDLDVEGNQFVELAPQQYSIRILPAGAPRADPALFDTSVNLASGDASTLVLIPVFQTPDELSGFVVDSVERTAPAAGFANVAFLHGVVDLNEIDIIAVPPGDDLSLPENQIELATGVSRTSNTATSELAAGTYDILVFNVGVARDDRANAALVAGSVEVTDGQMTTLVLAGSVDPDDLPIAGVRMWPYTAPPSAEPTGAAFHCVDSGNGVFGWCQQTCPEDGTGFGNAHCAGDDMGCVPTFLNANLEWRNLCGPVGDVASGERCIPGRTYGECEEGTYCLEYGNGQTGFDSVRRGICTEHCVVGEPDHPNLQCADGLSCGAIAFNGEYQIGRCGVACTPNNNYSDDVCPAGLESCTPIASTIDDPVNPVGVREEQPFCSASGLIEEGETCRGSDCVAGTECLFPRSAQTDFVSTLLSQYFGGVGLSPTCTAQCDPFDGDSSDATCGPGETCLFNFPWSAEVGHCAPIVETVTPLSACTRPGEACGENAICAINGGANICFEFCQYEGPNQLGQLQQSGCAGGTLCNPLINDIGVCLAPQ